MLANDHVTVLVRFGEDWVGLTGWGLFFLFLFVWAALLRGK